MAPNPDGVRYYTKMMNLLTEIFSPGALEQWHLHTALRLLIAAVLGGILGAEREYHGRSAGFRTMMLVCLGSALAMVVSLNFERVYNTALDTNIRVDPARIAYSVMAGVGFLGAGSIIQSAGKVRGLTTAASLWCTAAIGLAVGFGMLIEAGTATAITLTSLWWLRGLDRRIPSRRQMTLTARFQLDAEPGDQALSEALAKLDARCHPAGLHHDLTNGIRTVRVEVEITNRRPIGHVIDAVKDLEGLLDVRLD
ncbi:MAG: MgtC/SapB family protein [Phycisphaerae bacterium]